MPSYCSGPGRRRKCCCRSRPPVARLEPNVSSRDLLWPAVPLDLLPPTRPTSRSLELKRCVTPTTPEPSDLAPRELTRLCGSKRPPTSPRRRTPSPRRPARTDDRHSSRPTSPHPLFRPSSSRDSRGLPTTADMLQQQPFGASWSSDVIRGSDDPSSLFTFTAAPRPLVQVRRLPSLPAIGLAPQLRVKD